MICNANTIESMKPPGGFTLDLNAVAPNVAIGGLESKTGTDANRVITGAVSAEIERTSGVTTATEASFDISATSTTITGIAMSNSPWNTSDSAADDKTQPWVTALEFAIETAGTKTLNTSTGVLTRLTEFLHGQDDPQTTDVTEGHGLSYETTGGAAKYGRRYGGPFNLSGYMAKSDGNVVNCYDQAAALTTFGRLLGIEVRYAYMNKFGYINTVNLVGVGDCNNPFYENGTAINSKVVGNDLLWSSRTGFGNHAFVMLGDNVYDACALTVNKLYDDYLADAIDTSTPDESAAAGTLTNRAFYNVTIKLP
ncbi:MAG: hypothetical protein Q4D38_14940 [Planctomycetia bacterium]|nr:hypothetical protein [Planctomycetia bacterium]